VQPHLGSQFFWKDVRPEFCWTIALCSKSAGLQKAQITLTSRVTANDVAGSSTTFKEEHRTTSPPGTPPPPNAPQISVPISGNGVPTSLNPGQAGTLTSTVQNTTGVQANNLLLTMNIYS
jgi:hypothetical protein